MNLLIGISIFLLNSIVGFYMYTLFARLWMQKCRVNYWNPVSQFVVKLTDPIVKPCRRVIPGYRGFDLSIIFLIFAFEYLLLLTVFFLTQSQPVPWGMLIVYSIGHMFLMILNIISFFVIVAAISSWIQSRNNHFIANMVGVMVRPIMTLVRRFVPRIGGSVDLSPLVVLLFVQVLRMVVLYFMAV